METKMYAIKAIYKGTELFFNGGQFDNTCKGVRGYCAVYDSIERAKFVVSVVKPPKKAIIEYIAV